MTKYRCRRVDHLKKVLLKKWCIWERLNRPFLYSSEYHHWVKDRVDKYQKLQNLRWSHSNLDKDASKDLCKSLVRLFKILARSLEDPWRSLSSRYLTRILMILKDHKGSSLRPSILSLTSTLSWKIYKKILERFFPGKIHSPVESSLPGPFNQWVMVHKSSKTLSTNNGKKIWHVPCERNY